MYRRGGYRRGGPCREDSDRLHKRRLLRSGENRDVYFILITYYDPSPGGFSSTDYSSVALHVSLPPCHINFCSFPPTPHTPPIPLEHRRSSSEDHQTTVRCPPQPQSPPTPHNAPVLIIIRATDVESPLCFPLVVVSYSGARSPSLTRSFSPPT